MSSPIDINSNTNGLCDKKCSYSFKYIDSTCQVSKQPAYILLSHDKSSTSPVLYNNVGYDVIEVRLYTKSLHSYNGKKEDGEMIIIHKPRLGGTDLLVCIPITSAGGRSTTNFLDNAINEVSTKTQGLIGGTYNLGLFVPLHKPYYSYSAISPFPSLYQPKVDFIVFDNVSKASLNVTRETLLIMQTLILNNSTINPNTNKSIKIYNNVIGAGVMGGGDDIYIDCQPVGHTETTVPIMNASLYTPKKIDIFNTPGVQVVIWAIIALFIIFAMFACDIVIDWFRNSNQQ